MRFNGITPLGSSTNVRNRAECIYPPDLDPLVYDRLDYLSMFDSLDNVSKETKLNIQAVRKLYLSKALVPKEGHTMYFRRGATYHSLNYPYDLSHCAELGAE